MPSTRPTVSVVVPTYQGAGLVERCLASLVSQDGEVLDIVVVDDGSPDATCDAVEAWPEARLVRQAHQGVAAARNAGVAAARAPFVGFCDQDDEWLPGKARTQAEHLRTHPDVGAVLGQSEVVFDGVDRPAWLVDDQEGRPGGIQPLSGLFRAEALARVRGFIGTPAANDDFDLLVRLRDAGVRIDVTDALVMRRHIHEHNASHALGTYEHGMIDVLRRRAARARR